MRAYQGLRISFSMALLLVSVCSQADMRTSISVVGSSTVFPFAKVVAERFGKTSAFRTPTIEQTGTGGGFKEFCKGIGIQFVDINNASRRIKPSEFKLCQRNGVSAIVEMLIGYDGIALANARGSEPMALSRKDIFLALAKKVPNPNGSPKLIDNPYKYWRDVNPALPKQKIHVFGPPSSSGTRDAFLELVMEAGCEQTPWLAELKQTNQTRFKKVCHILREDGAFVDTGENDNLIVQKLTINPKAVGIFGFSFLDQNGDKVQAVTVDGQAPSVASISNGDYVVSRPLYVYVKKAHVKVIPGMREFLLEFTSEKAWGEEGYLVDKGMIPLTVAERMAMREQVLALREVHGF